MDANSSHEDEDEIGNLVEVTVQLLMAIEREERVVVKTWATGDDLEMISGEPGLSSLGRHVCVDSVAICQLRRLEAIITHTKIVHRVSGQPGQGKAHKTQLSRLIMARYKGNTVQIKR